LKIVDNEHKSLDFIKYILKQLYQSCIITISRKSSLGEVTIQIHAAARKHRKMPMGQQVLPK